MTYVVVVKRNEVIGTPFGSYNEAYTAAIQLFGDSISDWISNNLRIEECR